MSLSYVQLHIYIFGDFNINILIQNYNTAQNLVNTYHSSSLFSTLNKPTRVTKNSAMLINHFWTNSVHKYLTSGIIFNLISDHFPIISSFSVSISCNVSTVTTFQKRIISFNSIQAYKNDLSKFQWISLAEQNLNVNFILESYLDKFLQLHNNTFH